MTHARAKFTGTYNGKSFQYIDPEGAEGSIYTGSNPAFFWSEDGNFGCDCNRAYLVGEDDLTCGETIRIQRIEPIVLGEFEAIELGECDAD